MDKTIEEIPWTDPEKSPTTTTPNRSNPAAKTNQPTNTKPSWGKRVIFAIIVLALLFAGWRFFLHKSDDSVRAANNSSGSSGGRRGGGGNPNEVVPILAAAVTTKDFPVQLSSTGNVESISTVSVRSLVSGELLNVFFNQGDDVKKGQLLFTIDPRPYQQALAQAKAQLAKDINQKTQAELVVAKDRAQLKNAQVQQQRYADLAEQGLVSKEQSEQFQTTAETANATMLADQAIVKTVEDTIKADQSVVANAEVELGYTSIHAPSDGRTGSLIVNKGNLVRANDTTALVTINQVAPIFVTFTVPEKELARIRDFNSKGTLKVAVNLPDNPKAIEYGKLDFIDNIVDVTTGTIKLKAKFENSNKTLWPGQFVNVVLTLTEEPNVLVVPSQAVQIGQNGAYVYAIKQDGTVEMRNVVTAGELEGLTAIKQGVTAGEQVVTDGQLRLVPGSKVIVKSSLNEGVNNPGRSSEHRGRKQQ